MSFLKKNDFSDQQKYCNIEGLQCLTDYFGKYFESSPKITALTLTKKPSVKIDSCRYIERNVVKLLETVNRLHAKGFDKPGLVCDCVPSCIEPEFKVVTDSKGCVGILIASVKICVALFFRVKTSHSEILIKMDALPTSRFKRAVVRTTLDLVGK